LHYIVATSYVHHIHLKVYKLAQRVLAWWIWPLFDIMKNLDFKLGDEQVKAVPCPLVVGLVLGVLSTTCQSGLLSCSNINTHDLMVFGSFTERAKVNMHAMIIIFGGKKFNN
jgi:hypothetical protein